MRHKSLTSHMFFGASRSGAGAVMVIFSLLFNINIGAYFRLLSKIQRFAQFSMFFTDEHCRCAVALPDDWTRSNPGDGPVMRSAEHKSLQSLLVRLWEVRGVSLSLWLAEIYGNLCYFGRLLGLANAGGR
jgi:hypothetical protein